MDEPRPASMSCTLKVLTPIWGEKMAKDVVLGEGSIYDNEGLRQMCVIWQSSATIKSEESADEDMALVYTTSGASAERAAALVKSLKKHVCTR